MRLTTWFAQLTALLMVLPATGCMDGDNVGTTGQPITAPPFVIAEEQKLTPGGSGIKLFGSSAAVSGNTALIGGWRDASDRGSVWVFEHDGTWTQQTKLSASDAATGDDFGVSLSWSGDLVAIGASGENGNRGAVYIFERSGNVWTEKQKLVASDAGGGDRFGSSLQLDGDTLIVGAPNDDDGASNAGAAYIFVDNAGVWSEQQKLARPSPATNWLFGTSVSISGDTVVVGAPTNTALGTFIGTAHAFTRSGSVWSLEQELVPNDPGAQDGFGTSVSLLGDTALVGAPLNDNPFNSGSAYIFTRSGSTWTQQKRIRASDGSSQDRIGTTVLLTEDFAIVGGEDFGDLDGLAYVYERGNDDWATEHKLAASAANGTHRFGSAFAVSNDTLLVGAWGDDPNGTLSGSAFMFRFGFDEDVDGLPNTLDNCPFDHNPTQPDADADGLGDQCDPLDNLDFDGDGVANDVDNCPLEANVAQTDSDGDGLGNACDPSPNDPDPADVDGDGVANHSDNCPFLVNPSQADSDGDGLGDLCDASPNDPDPADVDSDGVANTADNCPFVANAGQADDDGDGLGDVCDPSPNDPDPTDVDGDGVTNADDNCPFDDNADQTDSDADGVGDDCDPDPNEPARDDVDGDGVTNASDNCAFVANADQADIDEDGLGDACDPSDDSGDDGGDDGGGDGGGGGCTAAGGNTGGGMVFVMLALAAALIRRRADRPWGAARATRSGSARS